jgi:hypothetical protein
LRDKASPCDGVARELGQKHNGKTHHAALPYAEVGSFLQRLRQRQGPSASRLAFEFLILTATRQHNPQALRFIKRTVFWLELYHPSRPQELSSAAAT